MKGHDNAVAQIPGAGTRKSQRVYDAAFAVLINVALLVVLLTVGDYGISFDEEVQHCYGEHLLHYYASGFKDQQATCYGNLYLYGGLFEIAAVLATRAIPLDMYLVRHLLSALAGLLCVLGLWKLVRTIGGPRAAFFAAFFLLLTPRFYGQIFLNPKDIPFATGYVWSLYYIARVSTCLPRPAASLLLRTGLAIGAALGIRVGGLILLGYLGVLCGAYAAWRIPRTPGLGARMRLLSSLAAAFLVIAVIAWVVMLSCWPWAQQAPLVRPFRALAEVTHFEWTGGVLVSGTSYPAKSLPWWYASLFLLVTLPEAILALLAVGAGMSLALAANGRWFSAPRLGTGRSRILVGFLILAVVFPLGYVAVRKSVLYNGIRHLLFVLPPLVGLAALSFEALLRKRSLRHFARRLVIGLLLVVLLLPTAHGMVHLHPLQYIYFNRLVGGVPGAIGRYDVEYWRASFREAVLLLCDHIEAESHGRRPDDYKVMMGGKAISSYYYFPHYLSVARTPDEVDFVIRIAESKDLEWLCGVRLLGVQRYGIDVAIVHDRRDRLTR